MCKPLHNCLSQAREATLAPGLLTPPYMNALLLTMMLSAATASEVLPPLPAPEMAATAPLEARHRLGPPVSPFLGVGFFVAGELTSLVTTGSFWFADRPGSSTWRVLSPFGMIVAAIPFVGPIAGFCVEAGTRFAGDGSGMRAGFNVLALGLQVGGLLFALRTRTELRERREARPAGPVQLTGIAVDPLDRGAALRLSGNFDFVR